MQSEVIALLLFTVCIFKKAIEIVSKVLHFGLFGCAINFAKPGRPVIKFFLVCSYMEGALKYKDIVRCLEPQYMNGINDLYISLSLIFSCSY